MTTSSSQWCGYSAPFLGRCACGDAANHEPGGKFYKPGREKGEPPSEGEAYKMLRDIWRQHRGWSE